MKKTYRITPLILFIALAVFLAACNSNSAAKQMQLPVSVEETDIEASQSDVSLVEAVTPEVAEAEVAPSLSLLVWMVTRCWKAPQV